MYFGGCSHVNQWGCELWRCNDVPDDFKNVALLMFTCMLPIYLPNSLPKFNENVQGLGQLFKTKNGSGRQGSPKEQITTLTTEAGAAQSFFVMFTC